MSATVPSAGGARSGAPPSIAPRASPINRATGVTVRQDKCSKIREDEVMIRGGTGLDFRPDIWKNSRGVLLEAQTCRKNA